MAARQVEVDLLKSTGAYPMDADPQPLFIDADIDYSKSTGEYPMYDERNVPERVVEHYTAPVEAKFVTPGPASSGHEAFVAAQRSELGLSEDPSGESDAGYEARPSTIPAPGADGVDREVKVVEAPDKKTVKGASQATGK